MKRTVFIEDNTLSLVQYTRDDDMDLYNCTSDIDTQRGFNSKFDSEFPPDASCFPFSQDISQFPFWAAIYDKINKNIVGVIRLSPPPYDDCDLAIWIYKPYRNMKYGTRAFRLGVIHCLDNMKLKKVGAGCYKSNAASRKMLSKIGFIRDEANDSHETDAFTGAPIMQQAYLITKKDIKSFDPSNGY